jgi:hypothetical protein
MWPTFDQLSYFNHELDFQRPLEELPRLAPHFFLPPLENKPQNPIMDILKPEALNTNMPARSYEPLISKELAVLRYTNHEGAGKLANESNPRIMDAGGYTETWD